MSQKFNNFSKKSYFIIVCTVEPTKGYGNLNRCLIISKLLSKSFQILFVIRNNSHARQLIVNKGFECKLFSNSLDEISFLKNLYKKTHFTTLLLDVRERGEFFAKKLQNKNFKIIQFDDAWCKNIFADLYFNGLPQKTKKSFIKNNPNVKLCVGSKFWISDDNFYLFRKSLRSITVKNHHVVTISLGGSDPQNITKLILNSIISLQNITIFVIVGPFFNDIKFLERFKRKNDLIIIKNNFSLWKIFQNSDVVICSAGNTVFDLILQRVPTLCIPIVEHQNEYSQFLHSKHLSINLGIPSKLSSFKIKTSLNLILNDLSIQKKLMRSGKSYFDGNGTSRVVSQILRLVETKN